MPDASTGSPFPPTSATRIAVPALRRYQPPSVGVPVAPMARQSVVSRKKRWPYSREEGGMIVQSVARSVDLTEPCRPIPPARSTAQLIKGGPILYAIIRPWYWGAFTHRADGPQSYGHSPIPIGPGGEGEKWSLAGGSIQAPRPRWTHVMRVPQYPTAPPELAGR